MNQKIKYIPEYRRLWKEGELRKRIEQIQAVYSICTVCPRICSTDRLNGATGQCNTGILPTLSSVSPHFGEEAPLTGYYGSGTVFLTGCNLNCIYCQNYDISQLHRGQQVSYEQLADSMLSLQASGCHNINFVTPTHQIYAILKSLEIAVEKGLTIPLVYNSGGYDSVETLKILEGIFDIFMPDFKYWNSETGLLLSGVPDYPVIARSAIEEMYRQVGDLQIDNRGVAYRGLIVRHLVLPGYIEESKNIIDFIGSISKGIYLNLMDQYRPEYRASEVESLKQKIKSRDFLDLSGYAKRKGIWLAE